LGGFTFLQSTIVRPPFSAAAPDRSARPATRGSFLVLMQLIRSSAGKVIVPLIVLAFVGWMVFETGMDVLGGGAVRPGELGSVNGIPITAEAFNLRRNELLQQAQAQGPVDAETARRIDEQVWEQLVAEILIRQEIDRRGLRVSDREILWAARHVPHPGLMQEEIFLTDGAFDLDRYRQFLASPSADARMLAQLEAYYREAIPRDRLVAQLSSGRYATDAELWREFRHQHETVTVDFVAMDMARIAEPQITDAQVRRYFDANRERFRRGERAVLRVAYLPLTVTEADRAATLERARELRAGILAGADFGDVARRESADPGSRAEGGDLGTFTRGQMVPEFDDAVFTLPVGAVSEPVVTQFGAHLIQVQARDGDEATARHILLEFAKGEDALVRMEEQMEAIRARARAGGLQAAATGQPGVVYREGAEIQAQSPYLPGVGSAMEALNWAEEEAQSRREGEGEGVSEVLESAEALYLVEFESYSPAGVAALAEVAGSIRALLAQRARIDAAKALADSMAAETRRGRSLEEVSEAHGLSVERAGPFTRVAPNPRFGQANEAIGVAFGTPVGRVGAPAATSGGVFLIRPVERTEADRREWERQKAEQRTRFTSAVRQDAFRRWLESAREEARIRDNRARMLARS
jgi:peptidyl-prolyl cis-trans isomerase D